MPRTPPTQPPPFRFFRGVHHARRNPYPLMLWLLMGGSGIVFLFLCFMLVVRKYTTGLPPLHLPQVFYLSTGLIVISSLTLWAAQENFRQESYRRHLNWVGVTLVLGLIFCLSQALGWLQLYQQGMRLGLNAAWAFFLIISVLHFAHVIVGVSFLLWTLVDASRNSSYIDGFIQSLNPAKRTRLRLAVTFWHYLDALWLALFGVLVFVL